MSFTIEGGCLCGAVRYRITAAPESGFDAGAPRGTYCHCSMCRKATGGGYAALFGVPRDAISWTGTPPTRYRSSPIASRGFCSSCGSPLFYDGDAEDHLAVTAGSLDDPSGFTPDHHYGVESRLSWVECGADLPGRETTERFEGQPSGLADDRR